jgi:glycerol-3-phosphate dehydrogenase
MSYDYIMNNVKSRWAGLRPLVFENAEDESKINSKQASRKHVIEQTSTGPYLTNFFFF